MRRILGGVVAALVALGAPSFAVVGPSAEGGGLAAHVVMVLKRSANTAGFCTGTVVAPNAILTAAHCVGRAADTRVHYRDGGGAPMLLAVAEVAINPGFRADAIRTRERSIDLALVRLTEPLPGRFHPAPLDTSGDVAIGHQFRLAGFGVAREAAAETGGVLRVAVLAARAPLSTVLLWAEDPSGGGAGACTGDSGAPVFAKDDAVVVAVTSWASGSGAGHCGSLTQAVLVKPQGTWIGAVLARWGTR
ncbi:MAG: trypsin-like serine protease [Methylobacteriaceae bacterium]|nr:trypsin-like serine protease [Methylobacteriaceae bacterium]